MKSYAFSLLALIISVVGASAGPDLSVDWESLVREAAADAKVAITTSHTGIFEGVYTMNPTPDLGHGQEGDAALALYLACTRKFGLWCEANKAKSSVTQGSDGEMMERMRAENGDYLSLIYRAPTGKDVTGMVTIIYVNAAEFAKGIPTAGE